MTMEVDRDPSPLCCCEYRNVSGQRTHLLALCCDCEDLDNTVDQCLKRRGVSTEKFGVVCNVISDRIRIPWPSGAKKLNMEFVIPLLLLPSSLYFASLDFVFTVLSLVYLPIFVIMYYVYALRMRKRTWFFVSWASTSISGIYFLYMFNVSHKCSLTNTLAMSLGYALIIVFYYRVVTSKDRLQLFAESTKDIGVKPKKSRPKEAMNGVKVDYGNLSCCFCTYGPFTRSKHCRICRYCVPRSDHHCVWTNCCIGHHNQADFLITISSFIITGGWGIYLSLKTICQSQPGSWHMDCSTVYKDSRSSMVFVGSFYGIVFVVAMAALLMQQLFFISFNITGDEWRRVPKHKSAFENLWTNPRNKGFLQNWREFLQLHPRESQLNYELV